MTKEELQAMPAVEVLSSSERLTGFSIINLIAVYLPAKYK